MRVYQLAVLTVVPGDPPSATILVSASDLSQFSFYQRGSVGEFMTFMSKTVAERTLPSQRQSVQEGTYTAHCYNQGGPGDLTGTSRLHVISYYTPWHKKADPRRDV
jgi:synaptobrevin family protein YKT6